MTITPTVAWRLEALLGEGPAWFAEEAALRFVDIKRGRVHRFDPASGVGETQCTGGMPSFIVGDGAGGLLVGSQHGVFELGEGGLGRCIAEVPQPGHNRTNDGAVDRAGRLWFGTMDDREQEPTGEVWCLDAGTLHRAGPSAVVTNGPAASGCGQYLYHVNSGERTIWRHRLDAGALLGESEVFVRIEPQHGYPDGIVVDAEGCLWVALWDGWGLRRYAPDGTLLLHVAFPCARVTKLAFGGPNLRTAYVTTARIGLSEAELIGQPLAGSLFTFEAPVPGLPAAALRRA